ncbi:unnamed protein product [Moneuplotes crassus]|uniref:Phosphatidic acid phosphatase type 2/haloperoxidase domain-containing protein n=1 Tax=Euplotes crassus TaxID=5936 RepID=A0AAD1XH37_EUPCR|nr:unnamed protein product [Moneuplotes crassus]
MAKSVSNGAIAQPPASKAGLYIALVVISLLTMILMVPSVFEWLRSNSLEVIITIRKDYSQKNLDKLMDLISAMGDKYGIFLALCCALAVLNMNNYLMLIGVSSFGVAVNLLVKMLIRDARPYFYSPDYQPVSCDFEYGSPSGHGQSVTTFYLSFITLLVRQYGLQNKKLTLYVVGYSYCVFMCFTRIFVGLHTAEQLLLGFGLGLMIHILFVHILVEYFDKLYEGIETGKTRLFNRYIVLLFLMVIFATLLYLYIERFDPAPQYWLDTVKKSCPPSKHFISFHYSCLNKYLVTFGSLGAYFGCYFRRWVLKFKDGSKFTKPKTVFKTVIRVLINIAFVVILSVPSIFIPKTSPIPVLLFVKGFFVPFAATFSSMLYTGKIVKFLNI